VITSSSVPNRMWLYKHRAAKVNPDPVPEEEEEEELLTEEDDVENLLEWETDG
jgi:hypothetical protein